MPTVDAAPPEPPTFAEDIHAAGLDEVSDVAHMREVADIICDALRSGATKAQERVILANGGVLTGEQVDDMMEIAVRHECEDQA